MDVMWKGDDGFTRFGVKDDAKAGAKRASKPKASKDDANDKPKE